jgi:predicted permease
MLNALVPVFSLILIGVFLKYFKFPGAEFWRGAERITYYILFPSLLFLKLSVINISDGVDLIKLLFLLIIMLILISLMLVLVRHVFSLDAAVFTSLFQGGIRFNTYVGLAVVNGLLGDSGVSIAAIVVGIMIPIVNLLCISAFAFAGKDDGISAVSIIKQIVTNPLILACAAGIIWNQTGVALPELLVSVLGLLSTIALPLGLLAVGAGVQLSLIGHSFKPLIISSTIKLLLSPLLAYSLCLLFGMEMETTLVVVVMASLPTASSAYILSRELGGDSNVMAVMISVQTFVAMIIMPVVIGLLS